MKKPKLILCQICGKPTTKHGHNLGKPKQVRSLLLKKINGAIRKVLSK